MLPNNTANVKVLLKQRTAELASANQRLAFQNEEKANRAAELVIANTELVYQINLKADRAAELNLANLELNFQNTEKANRAAELVIAKTELVYQNNLKADRAAELILANIELIFQNTEKAKRAAELVVANIELIFQNTEKAKRAAELVVANKELKFQNSETEKRIVEIQKTQLLLKSSLESPKDMMILSIDRDYNYFYFNEAYRNAMKSEHGIHIEVGMNALKIISNDLERENKKYYYDLALKGESGSEIIKQGNDFNLIYETFYNPIINEHHDIIGATAFSRNVSNRIHQEEEIRYLNDQLETRVLERTAELESVNQQLTLQNEKIKHLSYYDYLTDLYNRMFFEEEKKRLDTERQLPISIIMGDINGLKLINDVFGHSMGDKVLIEIGNILKSCCRREDVIARVGGDEFTILLPQTDSKTAELICIRITKLCIESRITTETTSFCPSISLGHSTKTDSNVLIDSIVSEADKLMLKHKLLKSKSAHSSIVASIKSVMTEKNQETEEHANRLIGLTKRLGEALSLTEDQLSELELLSALHDIGKVIVDNRILTKTETLTDEDWVEIKKHSEAGYRIALATVDLMPIAECILHHHERWDGNGYPQNQAGTIIPLLSRIVSVVDAYDAMTNERVYRSAMKKEEALEEIEGNAGTQFDPDIARLFVQLMRG